MKKHLPVKIGLLESIKSSQEIAELPLLSDRDN